ncbi:hypothetical protein EDD80_103292 [Anseongella ginsenosidimutans]|uniref:Uncharacterized protein n=1 Tax=Anseongella ginsenosidimutans TaxID=496056 RepID=A0A4R3KTS2_9SPHI|nr:hypothetical protein EDD80_103292 [Anseongella ginsenosidimutans]
MNIGPYWANLDSQQMLPEMYPILKWDRRDWVESRRLLVEPG